MILTCPTCWDASGFKLDTSAGGSAVGQYTRLANNFLLGNYNVNSNLETDDGSSRYLLYNNCAPARQHASTPDPVIVGLNTEYRHG